MHNLNKKGAVAPPWLTPVIAICSAIKTTLYVTNLYGKVAFVEALLYVGRSSIEIQLALCRILQGNKSFQYCISIMND